MPDSPLLIAPARDRGASWKLGLLGSLGFGIFTVLECLFVNAQTDSLAYVHENTNVLGMLLLVVWLVGELVTSYLAGRVVGKLGSGVVTGLLMGGVSGIGYILLSLILSPYMYGSPSSYGPWSVFFIIFVVGIISSVLAMGAGALAGLIGGGVGLLIRKNSLSASHQ